MNGYKIGHILPFAPNACGLYEAGRDMMRADIEGGNQVVCVDTGTVYNNGNIREPQIGAVDDRAGFRIETTNVDMLKQCDVIIMHTGCPDQWLVTTDIPLIWVIHGRPMACFVPENQGKNPAYSLYHTVSNWPRTKKVMYFWPEFKKHWFFIPEEKHLILNPVIDENRFNVDGGKYNIQNHAKYNLIICDSDREDIGLYEILVACIEACKVIKGIKIHVFGLDFPLNNAYNILLGKLKEVGGLGDLNPRIGDMELVYRSMDGLISPNRIVTRTIAEAISCGLPVLKQSGENTDYMCTDWSNVNQSVKAIEEFLNFREVSDSSIFKLSNYHNEMNRVYKELVKQ